MAIIFDGKAFASQKEKDLKMKVSSLRLQGIIPHLSSILIGSDPASRIYVNLKKKAAERIGAELDIYYLNENTKISEILQLINSLNNDEDIQGIMVQLPLPDSLKPAKYEIINSIFLDKDVDGLRTDSKFLHPTSKAVIEILNEAKRRLRLELKNESCKAAVVGETGMVGVPLVKELKKLGYELINERNKADVLISCTGKPKLIEESMVKEGAIVIDVGSPKGDVDFNSVSKKAGFITPVPGGVGPVTISCLLENLILACYNFSTHAD